ncbi:MAG: tRNA (adenosine(37)-N6)-dimethylallyltransferase MiaA [Bacteroidota bacterium]
MNPEKPYNLLAILGPTASGKTSLAARMAAMLDGEVISADSRQVYRGMDIGTGKDLGDYLVDGNPVPVHLVDVADAGYQYNVFEYQRDFLKVFADMQIRGKFPVLCGGSGLYLEAVLQNYRLIQVPVDEDLRSRLSGKSLGELTEILKGYKSSLHNITDIVNEKRAIRAIEIEQFYAGNRTLDTSMPELRSLVVGVRYDRQTERKRITHRLEQRLHEGMVEEVKRLLDKGVTPDELIYYGLEYKFITRYLIGDISYLHMKEQLNTAIHQFAKRQMTWFRRMERQGTLIHWLDGEMPQEEKTAAVLRLLER